MKRKIVLLTQWFDPEPTFKGLLFAKELVRQGFDVEVITGFPNYPGGKVYPGYRIKWIQRESVEGVRVTRLPLYPNHDQSAIKRVLNYVSFGVTTTTYGIFFMRRPDVMYAYHPPLTVGIAAVVIKFFRRIPVVYDVQDMWPDTLRATGMISNRKALAVISKVCDWVYKRVDSIVVLSPGFKRLITERGVSAAKINLIYNWADELALANPSGALPEAFPSADSFKIVFAGNMGNAQALDAVLDAAEILQRERSNVTFVLIGGGVDLNRLKTKAIDKELKNVLFLPSVPMAEVGMVLKAADALLVHLRKDPLFKITIPSKVQAYMSVGKPILMAVDGDAADLVNRAGCGVAAKSQDPGSIANAARTLQNMDTASLELLGSQAKKFYFENMSLKSGVAKFSEIFEQLASLRSKA